MEERERKQSASFLLKLLKNTRRRGVQRMIPVTLANSACIRELCTVNMHTDKRSEELYCILFLCLRITFLGVFLKPVSEFKYA